MYKQKASTIRILRSIFIARLLKSDCSRWARRIWAPCTTHPAPNDEPDYRGRDEKCNRESHEDPGLRLAPEAERRSSTRGQGFWKGGGTTSSRWKVMSSKVAATPCHPGVSAGSTRTMCAAVVMRTLPRPGGPAPPAPPSPKGGPGAG